MAESAAYARRGFTGAAVTTTLASGITSGATTLDGVDLSTWAAADDNGPFRFTISDGTTEEEVEATTVSSNTISGMTRGVGGTTAAAWSAGATLKHGSSVRDFDEANYTVGETVGKVTTAGDILVSDGANSLKRLGMGTARQNLAVNSGATDLAYQASLQSLMTAQGDIVQASSANTPARLAIGTARQNLAVNSGATALEYVASMQSLLTASGDIIYASAANTPARLAKGTDGHVLTLASGLPSWAAASGSSTAVGARSSRNSAQTINNSSNTDLADTAEAFDTDAINNAGLWTVPAGKGGKWLFLRQVAWTANATGTRIVYLMTGGGSVLASTLAEGHASAERHQLIFHYANLNAADTVKTVVAQSSGGTLDVIGSVSQTFAAAIYLGA